MGTREGSASDSHRGTAAILFLGAFLATFLMSGAVCAAAQETTLTLRTGTAVVAFGGASTLTGSLSETSGTPVSGRLVRLESAISPIGPFRMVATLTAAAPIPGVYAATVRPVDHTFYRLVFDGDDQYDRAASPAVSVTPRAWLSTLSLTKRSPLRRKPVVVFGFIRPLHAAGVRSVVVQCYRLERGRWRLRKTVATKNGTSSAVQTKWSGTATFTLSGKYKLVATHVDAQHAASTSAAKFVTVK